MVIFLAVFFGIICAAQLPLILALLYKARKIILGLVLLWFTVVGINQFAFQNTVQHLSSDEKLAAPAKTEIDEIKPVDFGSAYLDHARVFLDQMQKPWPGGKPPMPSGLAEPLYVNPKLMPTPAPQPPAPVVKPTHPAPTPVPVQPETLYTSK